LILEQTEAVVLSGGLVLIRKACTVPKVREHQEIPNTGYPMLQATVQAQTLIAPAVCPDLARTRCPIRLGCQCTARDAAAVSILRPAEPRVVAPGVRM
jgi:hypothetical protein